MKTRAQWLAVLALGGLWVGLMLFSLLFTPKPERVPLKYVTGQTASRESGRGMAVTGVKIRMDLLEAERRQAEAAFATPKNIFAPLRYEGSEGAVVKVRRGPVSPMVVPAAPPAPTPEELAAQAAHAELAQFRYLGFLSRNGRDEAFLSKGKELHIVRTGETIEERVLIKTITPKDVTLQETKSQVERTVLLASEGR